MSGIVFFRTQKHDEVVEFYTERVGADIWLEQEGCTILSHGNMLFGFCGRDEVDDSAIVTFYYDTKEEVDEMYREFEDSAEGEPEENEKYEIYQFFASDPEGRTVEFQTFLHELPEIPV